MMSQELLRSPAKLGEKLNEFLSDSNHEGATVLVTHPGLYQATHAEHWLMSVLKERELIIIDRFALNPNSEDLESLREMLGGRKVKLWIGLGGGSIIDMMKLLQLFSAMPSDCTVASYLETSPPAVFSKAPSLAIPTTAGTGSEATPFAVLYHRGLKNSLDFPELRPSWVALLPQTLESLPGSVRAASALDALSQAIESYWNIHSSVSSRALAKEAIQTIRPVIIPYVTTSASMAINEAMQQGAYLAGCAIAITRTTAPHAVSYPMTSRFNLPHGLAVGLTLGEFMEFNAKVTPDDCSDSRGAVFVKTRLDELAELFNCADPSAFCEFWRQLLEALGISWRLRNHGIQSDQDLQKILDEGFNPKRMKNNPRCINRNQLNEILKAIV